MSYDTINFKLQQRDINGVCFLNETPRYIDNVSEHWFSNGAIAFCGNVGGYKISVTESGVNIKGCSLTKWFMGDNFKEMGRRDTQQAIENLSDALHLPIEKANITRLDFALNIPVKHPIEVYFNHLGGLNHYKKLLQKSGCLSLYYSQNNEQYVFYDKVREQKIKGDFIPELYQDRNVLRIEQRYLKRIAQRLKIDIVTANKLYDVDFFNALYNRLGDTYQAIEKTNNSTINLNEMKAKRELYDMGVMALIEMFGKENVISQIKEGQQIGKLTKKQAYDLREAINEVYKRQIKINCQNDVIDELNKRVKESIKMNLSY